ncbi:MAG: hypothetical protein M1142_01700 [Patescibacteria group bacterium]|nr:hypothetical protein [Patescibacteria group bacterium]
MINNNLLTFKKNYFSQNGEDGIIEELLNLIKVKTGTCCEFGAWDGIHLSNTRNLIQKGWEGILIEADKDRFKQLKKNYKNYHYVKCINSYINTAESRLSHVLKRAGVKSLNKINFLSIDIDALDYLIFQNLDFRPQIICIEVNAAFSPQSTSLRKEVIDKIGCSLSFMSKIAKNKGYSLVCFTGNALYLRNDLQEKYKISSVTDKEAYINFLKALSLSEREWLFLVNLALTYPYYKFRNPFLTKNFLKISLPRIGKIIMVAILRKYYVLSKVRLKRYIYPLEAFLLKRGGTS